MRCRSASLAPSAAGKPQPRPPAELNAYSDPGRSNGQYSCRNEYSLITIESRSTTSRKQWFSHGKEIVLALPARSTSAFQPACNSADRFANRACRSATCDDVRDALAVGIDRPVDPPLLIKHAHGVDAIGAMPAELQKINDENEAAIFKV